MLLREFEFFKKKIEHFLSQKCEACTRDLDDANCICNLQLYYKQEIKTLVDGYCGEIMGVDL